MSARCIYMNFVTGILLFQLGAGCIFAQQIKWQNTIGGSGNDNLKVFIKTNDGGYLAGGYSNSGISGDKTENPVGFNDYWVIKTDASGNLLWQNTIGGSLNDNLTCATETSDGGFILGGNSNSGISGDKTVDTYGSDDIWLVKIDSAGQLEWQRTIGGFIDDHIWDIAQTLDGGYILGAQSGSPVSGLKTEPCLGNWDYWIIKTNSSGVIEWQNTIGGNGLEELRSVSQTNDGGYIIGGWSESGLSGDKSEPLWGVSDYWILKLDASGNIQWQNTIGGTLEDILYCVAETHDHGFIAGGWSKSPVSGDKAEGSQGAFDFWVVKLDSAGNIAWQNTIGGDFNDYLYTIVPIGHSGYILGGSSFSGTGGDKTDPSHGSADYWIIKIDTAGVILWQNNIGGTGNDYFYTIGMETPGEYFLGGYSSSGISYDKTESSNGSDDFWVMVLTEKYNLATGCLYGDLYPNLQMDSLEFGLSYRKVTDVLNGNFTYSGFNGKYSIQLTDSGNYCLQPDFSLNGYYANPAQQCGYFPGPLNTDSIKDFAFQSYNSFKNLAVHLQPVNPMISGTLVSYQVSAFNLGSINQLAYISLVNDTNLVYDTADFAPLYQDSDSLYFSIGYLFPCETKNFQVKYQCKNGIPPGTPVMNTVHIHTMIGDTNLADNSVTSIKPTTFSTFSNQVFVNEESIQVSQIVNPLYLEYTFYFQNMLNDTVSNFQVSCDIGHLLHPETIIFTDISHPCSITYLAYDSTFRFTFRDVLLPPVTADEIASRGYIRYRIKAISNLQNGNVINQNATILFNNITPLALTPSHTYIIYPQHINDSVTKTGTLFPNPVSQELSYIPLYASMDETEPVVYNFLGQKMPCSINQKNKQSGKITLDVSHFPAGIYFFRIEGEYNEIYKFVKM